MKMVAMLACSILVFVVAPCPAGADGMVFRTVGAQVDVQATRQRAVMWHRGAEWEIHIQPVFDRQHGRAAWVVPFPVQPDVQPGEIELFEQIELLTSPMFVKLRSESSSGFFSCGRMASDSAVATGGDAYVKVWDRGVVGELDYVVLSAETGDRLVDWLSAEGFEVPDGAGRLLSDFEIEGVFFFAARLSTAADPEKPLAPVRFLLPGMDPPAYPLRLTSLGVPPGDSLDLTVWVIFQEAQAYWPDSHSCMQFGYRRPRSRQEFDEALDELFTGQPDGLVVLHSQRLAQNGMMNRQICRYYGACVSFSQIGLEAPESWCREIDEINFDGSRVLRLQARLFAEGMAEDLVLSPVPSHEIADVSNVYVVYDGDLANAGLMGLVAAGFMLSMRRRRRR